jgi:hypothetical protein
MAGERQIMQASEGLIYGRGLNDTLIGKLLMRWGRDGEACGRALPAGGHGRLHRAAERVYISSP